ncbi:MAG: hypothetical protein IT267_04465 [Saprospiraceae bacterium]|nr:hypothetical protein [Saprospiraceae bacterium]
MFKNSYFYFFILINTILVSCTRENPSWEVGLLTPLIKSSLKIKDLSRDSLVTSDTSGLIRLVYSKNLNNISVDSFFSISDTTVAKSFAIDSLRLYNLTIDYPFTLGSIARQAGSIGLLILALQGNTIAIPSIGPLSVPKIEYNADTIFTSMSLDDGKIEVKFSNNLPIDITDVKFELRNVLNNELLVDGNFPFIKSNSVEAQTYSLAGKTFGSKIAIEVKSFSSPGSNNVPVLIDTNNSIVASLRVYDLRPNKATALWPAQNIIEQYLDFNLRRLNVELTYADIKSGKIFLKLKSTIDDTLHFYYDLPGATKNGVPFKIIKDLAPGTTSNPSSIFEVYDFSGYQLDLSGSNKDTFNATPNSIIVRIDSTGIQKTFSKADNIQVELGFQNLKPSYARGYMSMDTFSFGPATQDLEFFKDISGKVNFDDANMSVVVKNSIGTDAIGEIKKFKVINTRKQTQTQLTSTELNKLIVIPRAIDNNGKLPVSSSLTEVKLNKSNSNLASLISTLPDQIEYEIQMRTNPNGDLYGRKDFIYDGELLDISLQLDVPLNFSAEDLSLTRIENFNGQTFDLQNVIDGVLMLNFENQYPLAMHVQLDFIDDSGANPVKYFTIESNILPGDLDQNGKVLNKKSSLTQIPISAKEIENLNKANKIIIKARFSTKDNPNLIKIYDYYCMDLVLSASFNYKID